jgi:RimJ/RimL family protein N-acetyltransferase
MSRALPADDRDALAEEFAAYAIDQAHPLVREWCGKELQRNFRESAYHSMDVLTNEEFAQRFANDMALPGVPASSFKDRLLDIDGYRLIAGIHFRNLNPEFPFVGIERASIAPGTLNDLRSLATGLVREFNEFRPRAIWFYHPSHLPLRASGAAIDDHVLMAPARLMLEGARVNGINRVELKPPTDLDFYSRYQALYQQIYDERPHLRGEVRTESADGLGRCLSEGLLFEIHVDGRWSGVFAAARNSITGVRGIYVIEVILAKEVRGQGLGVAVHKRFAEAVAQCEPAAIILGTIWDGNLPSRRTAERAGRVNVGAFYFLQL